MLTGDKRQTAKNIALACNLIDTDMDVETPSEQRLLSVSVLQMLLPN
jgi:magnesium-transporting ATPase (P-type)